MRPVRITLVIVTAFALLHASRVRAVDADAVCQASKLKSAGVALGGLLQCHAQAAAVGTAVSPSCTAVERSRLEQSFARAEAGTCRTINDAATVWSTLDAGAASIASALRPAVGGSSCARIKLSAAGQHGSYLVKLVGKQKTRVNASRFVAGESSSAERIRRQFNQAEGQGGCVAVGDAAATQGKIHNLLGDTAEQLWPATSVGVQLTRPAGWHLDAGALALEGGVEFNNFASLYVHGGILPTAGATINLKKDAAPGSPLDEVARGDVAQEGTTLDSLSATVVDGETGVKATKSLSLGAPLGSGVVYRMVDVYVVRSSVLYKLTLTYRSDDSVDQTATFDSVVAGAQFVP